MPDDSPVETRHDDGLRTDNSATPAAPTGQPGPLPLANGAGDPADASPPGIDPSGTRPATADTDEPTAAAAPNGSASVDPGISEAEPVEESTLSAVDPAAAANGAGSPAAEAEPAGVAIDSGGRTVDPAGGKAAPLDGAAGEAAAQPAEAPPPAVAAGPSAPADPAGVAHAAAGTGASGDGPGDGEPAAEASDQTAKSTATGRKKAPARRGSFLRELPVLLVVAFGLALLIKTFLVQAFFIPSGSMEKTLHGCTGCSGDRVLVNKLVYRFHDPRPGDIVVFRGPESWAPEAQFAKPGNVVTKVFRAIGSAVGVAPAGEKDFVKRVIAVGGQTVQCCDPQGRVVVDGRPLDEPYVYLSDPDNRPQTFGPLKVPDGRLWMMGDHRDESADSRAHMSDADQGTIGVSDVIGKAFVIVWPPSRWDTLGTPSTFSSAATASAPYVVGLGLVAPVGMVRHRRRRGR